MYIYSEPFNKKQAVDYLFRPVNYDVPDEIMTRAKAKFEQQSFYEVFMLIRKTFPEHHIVRFGPEKLAFKYQIN